ncbi:neural cell adhesion molecule L1.1-like [Engraulis encrasicolus]|uniref:neural cell adhesion molecule L1.1-like n=1 Tax=Engraulis encrasicolus TaxID=184585 RepID=UPI002FD4FD8A
MAPAQCQQPGCRGPRGSLRHQHPLLCFLLLAIVTGSALGDFEIHPQYKRKDSPRSVRSSGYSLLHMPWPDAIKKVVKMPPTVTVQPLSVIAHENEAVTLECEASGNPEPRYRWEKDGMLFRDLEEIGDLVVNKSETLNAFEGRYRCYASNELGTAVSDVAEITAAFVPAVMKHTPERFRKEEGESLTMPCDPPPDAPPHKIYWTDADIQRVHTSERVTPGLDGYLYFANLIPSDSRNDYTCHIRYHRNMIIQEAITLTVTPTNSFQRHPPHILRPPNSHSSYVALKGQHFNLECIPKGLPTPTVTWKRKDSNQELPHRTMNHGRWLSFSGIAESDDGEYECIANNTAGVATHTYTLKVEAAPYFTKKPRSLLYTPGETVRLECQVEGIPTPVLTWSINGEPISDFDEPRRKVSKGALILTDVKTSDTAVYQCEAVNKHGTILSNTYINVVELPPQILTEDNKKYMWVAGKTASLECSAFGSPRPKVLWENEAMEPAQSHARMSQTVDGSLTITNVSAEDSGLYLCSVINTNLSIAAELEILNRSKIVTPPHNLRVRRGDNAIMTCDFVVDPRLEAPDLLHWLKNGDDINEHPEDDKYTIFANGSLKITNVSLEDAGSYTCEVATALDTEKASASITVVDKPFPPGGLTISAQTERSVSLSWVAGRDNNSPLTAYYIEMEEAHGEGPIWEEVKHVDADITQVEFQLRPYGAYRFRVIAENDIGRSHASQATPAHQTPPAIPEHFPKGIRSESTQPDHLVIAWQEMDKRDHYGPDFKYQVSWRPGQGHGHGHGWDSQLVSGNRFVVNGTDTFRPFEIKLKAVNSIGDGPDSPAIIGHSGEDVPLEAPKDVTLDLLNGTAIVVKWVPVPPQTVQGHLKGYRIHVRRLPSPGRQRRHLLERWPGTEAGREHEQGDDLEEQEERVLEVLGYKEEAVVAGLQFFSTYELTVTVFNSKGDGPHSTPKSIETPEGAPGPPIFLEFDSPSETELILHWRPPLKRNGVLTAYLLQYGPIVNGTTSLLEVPINDPTKTDYRLEHLNPQEFYYFSLQGKTAAGLGESTKMKGATLLDGVPPSLINVTLGEGYANLSWTPGDRYRNVVFQVHFLNKNAGTEWEILDEVNSNQGFFQLPSLEPGTEYRLRSVLNNSTYWEGDIRTNGPALSVLNTNFAAQGWFIGLISACVLLLLILLILCLIKRSKGGKYSVKDKEEGQGDSEGRPIKDEQFGEYSDNDEKRTMSQPSLCGESKLGSEDSLAEYGDSVDIQFNEDGSFIGQYSGRREPPHAGPGGGPESSGAGSPINNMPPQSISFNNSVTGILDRSN